MQPSTTKPPSDDDQKRYYDIKAHPYSGYNHIVLPPQLQLYLDTLVDIADVLGVDDLSPSSYASALDRLEDRQLALSRSNLRAHHAEDELSQHLLSSLHEQKLIDKWSQTLLEQVSEDTSQNVSALERRKAALTAKAKEYRKQLDNLMVDIPEAPPVSITELTALRKKIKQQEQTVQEKRAKIEAFQGLPPNISLARHALQQARDQQMELIQLRERLLGKMVDGIN